MTDPETPRISRNQLADLLDFESEEGPVLDIRDTLELPPQRLEQLLGPERTTANLVVLLDRPKRRMRGTPLVVAWCVAGVALGAVVTLLVV
ncbi:MAG TPA: hypothetical protein VLB44_27630 [Kofleriaceae bacterium]|nr:hypothetical protein [Kofleriaceae bacterium]